MRDYTAIWPEGSNGEGTAGEDSTKTYDSTSGGEVFWADFITPALPFYDPKTDWTSDDSINDEDFNAIESNAQTVAAYLESVFYSMPALTTVTNRTQTYVDFLAGINRIETNLDSIRVAFVTPPGYGPMEVWTVGKGFDYEDANRLENNLQLLLDYGALTFESFRYCGAATCGETGVLY